MSLTSSVKALHSHILSSSLFNWQKEEKTSVAIPRSLLIYSTKYAQTTIKKCLCRGILWPTKQSAKETQYAFEQIRWGEGPIEARKTSQTRLQKGSGPAFLQAGGNEL